MVKIKATCLVILVIFEILRYLNGKVELNLFLICMEKTIKKIKSHNDCILSNKVFDIKSKEEN